MKLFAAALCAVLCVFFLTPSRVLADAPVYFEAGGIRYQALEDAAAAACGYTGTDGKADIPETVTDAAGQTRRVTQVVSPAAGYSWAGVTELTVPASVTKMSNSAFLGCRNLKKATLNGKIEELKSVFKDCSSLTEVTLPKELKVQDGAFVGCHSLKKVSLPDGLRTLGGFEGCYSLTEIRIPDSVTKLSSYAFAGCSSLKEISLPDSVTSVGISAFDSCPALVRAHLSDQITEIPESAFWGDAALTEVTGGAGVVKIGNYAFEGGLTRLTSLPDVDMSKVVSIGRAAFSGCSALRFDGGTLNLASVRSIGSGGAFQGCSAVQKLIIGEGLKKVPASAFRNCGGLQSVQLPNSLTEIGSYAFSGTDAPVITVGSDDGSQLSRIRDNAFQDKAQGSKITIAAAEEDVTVDSKAFGKKDQVTWTVPSSGATDDRISDDPDALTLQEAINKASKEPEGPGRTVTIRKSILLSKGIVMPKTEQGDVTVTLTAETESGSDQPLVIRFAQGVKGPMFTVPAGTSLKLAGPVKYNGKNLKDAPILLVTGGKAAIEDGILTKVTSAAPEQGAVVLQGGSLTMTGGAVTKNDFYDDPRKTQYSAAVRVTKGASMTLSGGTISENSGSLNGAGGILVERGSSLTMTGGVIEKNTACRGGGVTLRGDQSNDASTRAVFNMSGGEIRNNQASSPTSSWTVNKLTAAQNGGGGVYVEGNAAFRQEGNAKITGNETSGDGGGVCTLATPAKASDGMPTATGGAYLLKGGVVSGNRAALHGGGIYSCSVNTVELARGRIENNSAGYYGGGVYASTQPYNVILQQALVTKNQASVMGGGVWLCPEGMIYGEIRQTEKTDGTGASQAADTTEPAGQTAQAKEMAKAAGQTAQVTDTAKADGQTAQAADTTNAAMKTKRVPGLGGLDIAVFGNRAGASRKDVKAAGNDVAYLGYIARTTDGQPNGETYPRAVNQIYSLGASLLGGGKVTWYQDGLVTNGKLMGLNGIYAPWLTYGAVRSDSQRDPVTRLALTGLRSASPRALTAKVSSADRKKAWSEATLLIQGNTARQGGGIGGNGSFLTVSSTGSSREDIHKHDKPDKPNKPDKPKKKSGTTVSGKKKGTKKAGSKTPTGIILTGDEANAGIFLAAGGAAGAALILLLTRRRRKQR